MPVVQFYSEFRNAKQIPLVRNRAECCKFQATRKSDIDLT